MWQHGIPNAPIKDLRRCFVWKHQPCPVCICVSCSSTFLNDLSKEGCKVPNLYTVPYSERACISTQLTFTGWTSLSERWFKWISATREAVEESSKTDRANNHWEPSGTWMFILMDYLRFKAPFISGWIRWRTFWVKYSLYIVKMCTLTIRQVFILMLNKTTKCLYCFKSIIKPSMHNDGILFQIPFSGQKTPNQDRALASLAFGLLVFFCTSYSAQLHASLLLVLTFSSCLLLDMFFFPLSAGIFFSFSLHWPADLSDAACVRALPVLIRVTQPAVRAAASEHGASSHCTARAHGGHWHSAVCNLQECLRSIISNSVSTCDTS